MPIYYFHIHDADEVVHDEEGSDHPDIESARAEAIQSAREIIANDAKGGRLNLDRRFEVKNRRGAVVVVVPFREAISN
jgi:hypothetical protein